MLQGNCEAIYKAEVDSSVLPIFLRLLRSRVSRTSNVQDRLLRMTIAQLNRPRCQPCALVLPNPSKVRKRITFVQLYLVAVLSQPPPPRPVKHQP